MQEKCFLLLHPEAFDSEEVRRGSSSFRFCCVEGVRVVFFHEFATVLYSLWLHHQHQSQDSKLCNTITAHTLDFLHFYFFYIFINMPEWQCWGCYQH